MTFLRKRKLLPSDSPMEHFHPRSTSRNAFESVITPSGNEERTRLTGVTVRPWSKPSTVHAAFAVKSEEGNLARKYLGNGGNLFRENGYTRAIFLSNWIISVFVSCPTLSN